MTRTLDEARELLQTAVQKFRVALADLAPVQDWLALFHPAFYHRFADGLVRPLERYVDRFAPIADGNRPCLRRDVADMESMAALIDLGAALFQSEYERLMRERAHPSK